MKTPFHFQSSWNSFKIASLLFLLTPQVIMAQSIYKVASNNSTKVTVNGQSNVHDWEMTSKDIESQGAFKFNAKDELIGLSAFNFSVAAKSLKSGKSSMDERTYKSIKATDFPKISYKLTSAEVTAVQANKYSIQTTGILNIAGKTQTISMKVMALVNADNSISCHGTEKLMLTDYGIEPPSFMFGAMKVGNNLVIKFDLDYTKTVTSK
ncbi:YceI family protein [Pedobacter sp. Du54]|uniref:YceI family protein n=1 Tax=Pedobacter anseongensis TaxID=3133439 RepID=UPI003094F119